MGFEDVIPPVPSREQELRFIQKMEDSFVAQPWYKLYMNEALRQKKMVVGEEVNARRKDYIRNYVIGSFLGGLALYHPIIRHYQKEGGVPFIYKPKGAIMETGYLQSRNRKMLTTWLIGTNFLAMMYAQAYSRNFFSDEYMVNKSVIVETFD